MSPWTVRDQYDPAMLDGILDLLSNEWWTADRSRDQVHASLEGAQLVFTAVAPDGSVVGAARVITDFAYLAMVLDVISAPAKRGHGVGAALMDAITNHPRLAAVDSIELVCQPGLRPFYERWGFTDQVGQSLLMRRTNNPALIGRDARRA